MPFNGSGTFDRVHDWTDDAANSIKVSATRMDEDVDDIVQNGLMNCLTKDAQIKPTVNFDMNGLKIINAANGVDATDLATVGQATKAPVFLLSAGANTLDPTSLGKIIIAPNGTAVTTVLLPSLSLAPNGSKITIVNLHSASIAINRYGSDTISSSGGSGYTTITMTAGQTLVLVSSGSAWYTVDGSAILSMPVSFGPFAASKVVNNGYLKIDGEIIIQWTVGSIASGSSTATITYPISFPTACLCILPTLKTTGVTTVVSESSKSASSCVVGQSPTTSAITVNLLAIGH